MSNTIKKKINPAPQPGAPLGPERPGLGRKKPQPQAEISIPAVQNIIPERGQRELWSKHVEGDDYSPVKWAEKFSVELTEEIVPFGATLTDGQIKLLEAILTKFTETKYEGNIEPRTIAEIEKRHGGQPVFAYKNIKHVPRIKITQAELLSGLSASHGNATEDFEYLCNKRFCFFWKRLVYDKDGRPERKPDGSWKKEEVMAVSPWLYVEVIRDEETKVLKHYEVEPSPVLLDQRESYYLVIPADWRDEVKKKIGGRKSNSGFFKYLLFLRLKYEMIRRYNKSHKAQKPYEVIISKREIAETVGLHPEIVYHQPGRISRTIHGYHENAKILGYLRSFDETGPSDLLRLNRSKYFDPDLALPARETQIISWKA